MAHLFSDTHRAMSGSHTRYKPLNIKLHSQSIDIRNVSQVKMWYRTT